MHSLWPSYTQVSMQHTHTGENSSLTPCRRHSIPGLSLCCSEQLVSTYLRGGFRNPAFHTKQQQTQIPQHRWKCCSAHWRIRRRSARGSETARDNQCKLLSPSSHSWGCALGAKCWDHLEVCLSSKKLLHLTINACAQFFLHSGSWWCSVDLHEPQHHHRDDVCINTVQMCACSWIYYGGAKHWYPGPVPPPVA